MEATGEKPVALNLRLGLPGDDYSCYQNNHNDHVMNPDIPSNKFQTPPTPSYDNPRQVMKAAAPGFRSNSNKSSGKQYVDLTLRLGLPGDKSCAKCNKTNTPKWRKGPLGPKTLCNACGIKYQKEELAKRRAQGGAN